MPLEALCRCAKASMDVYTPFQSAIHQFVLDPSIHRFGQVLSADLVLSRSSARIEEMEVAVSDVPHVKGHEQIISIKLMKIMILCFIHIKST